MRRGIHINIYGEAIPLRMDLSDEKVKMNYFDIFEINMQFELDEKILQDKYIQLQKKYHPDRAKNEEEKNKFIVMSADINQAYATLKNPYKRAAYILKLQNVDIEKEGRDAYKLPPELLSSILAKRDHRFRLSQVGDILFNLIEYVYNEKKRYSDVENV